VFKSFEQGFLDGLGWVHQKLSWVEKTVMISVTHNSIILNTPFGYVFESRWGIRVRCEESVLVFEGIERKCFKHCKLQRVVGSATNLPLGVGLVPILKRALRVHCP